MLAASLPISKQNSLFSFSPLSIFASLNGLGLGYLTTYLYGVHQMALALCLPFLGKMSSQQCTSPKRSLSRNFRINPLFSPPPNHILWIPWLRAYLLCIAWVQVSGASAFVWAPLSFAFVFFYFHDIPTVLALSPLATHVGLVLISHGVKVAWAFGLVLFPFISSWIGYCLGRSFCPSSPLGFYFYHSFSCYAHGLAGCHFCHVGPLSLLFIFLGFLGPFTLSLLLIVPMGLLAVILAMLAHWVYYLFSWVSSTLLLCLYLLLCPRAYWLLFLPCWPIDCITSLLRLPRPNSTFTSYCVYEPVDCHSCHVGPLNLLSYFYHLFPYCWASSAIEFFVKNRYQHNFTSIIVYWIIFGSYNFKYGKSPYSTLQ